MKALAGQSVTYAVAAIVARSSQMVTLLLLPLILTPTDYGAVQMIATAAILVNLILPLEITQGLARYYPGADAADQKSYSSTAWWVTAAAAATCLIVGFAAQRPLTGFLLGDTAYVEAFGFGLWLIALTILFYFVQNQCRWQFDAKGYAWVSILFAVGTMAGSLGLGYLISPSVHGVLLGQVLGALLAVCAGALRVRGVFAPVFDKAKLRDMLSFSLPLVPAQLAWFATVYASRVIVNDVGTLRDVGVFTFASQIAAIGSLATIGVNAALTPLVVAHHEDPNTPGTLARLFEGFTAVAIVLCLGLGLFAPELIRLIGNPAYAEAGTLVMIMAPAVLLTQMYIFAPGFLISKKTGYQLLVSVVGAAVGIAANYLFVTRWGIYGAALASLLSASVFLLLWFLLSQRLYPIPVRWSRVAVAVAAFAAIAAAGLWIPAEDLVLAIAYKTALTVLGGALCLALRLIPNPFHLFVSVVRGMRTSRSAADPPGKDI